MLFSVIYILLERLEIYGAVFFLCQSKCRQSTRKELQVCPFFRFIVCFAILQGAIFFFPKLLCRSYKSTPASLTDTLVTYCSRDSDHSFALRPLFQTHPNRLQQTRQKTGLRLHNPGPGD